MIDFGDGFGACFGAAKARRVRQERETRRVKMKAAERMRKYHDIQDRRLRREQKEHKARCMENEQFFVERQTNFVRTRARIERADQLAVHAVLQRQAMMAKDTY